MLEHHHKFPCQAKKIVDFTSLVGKHRKFRGWCSSVCTKIFVCFEYRVLVMPCNQIPLFCLLSPNIYHINFFVIPKKIATDVPSHRAHIRGFNPICKVHKLFWHILLFVSKTSCSKKLEKIWEGKVLFIGLKMHYYS